MIDHPILAAIEENALSIREGTDALVVLYRWRRLGGDDAGFAASIQHYVESGQIEILPGQDTRFRLTVQGFEQVSRVTVVRAEDRTDLSRAEWNESAAPSASLDAAALKSALMEVFRLMQLPPGRAVAANTLLKIWTLDGLPGADLRHALDLLMAEGVLEIQRQKQGAAFALTAQARSQH